MPQYVKTRQNDFIGGEGTKLAAVGSMAIAFSARFSDPYNHPEEVDLVR